MMLPCGRPLVRHGSTEDVNKDMLEGSKKHGRSTVTGSSKMKEECSVDIIEERMNKRKETIESGRKTEREALSE